uniref:Cystatin domain-containing protein n=1 Tax=Oryctolagus cuniculus TaxID=9986 RepID=A0A5F9CFF3_RABIT
ASGSPTLRDRPALDLVSMWGVNLQLELSPCTLHSTPTDINVNREGRHRALSFSMSRYSKGNHVLYQCCALQVVHSHRQIIAGATYSLGVEKGHTTCSMFQPDVKNCHFQVQPDLQKKVLFSFNVFNVPKWNKSSLVKSHCQDFSLAIALFIR